MNSNATLKNPYRIVVVALLSLIAVSCSFSSIFGSAATETPAYTPSPTITLSPTPTITPTPTPTPVPGIGGPLKVGEIEIMFAKASFQDEYKLDIEALKQRVVNETGLEIANGKLKLNGSFDQPGDSLFRPLSDEEQFLLVEASANPGDCDVIFDWGISFGNAANSVPINTIIATCWEMEDPESDSNPYLIYWALVVPKGIGGTVLFLPGDIALDLNLIIE